MLLFCKFDSSHIFKLKVIKSFSILIVLQLLVLTASATVFIVTSNANAGTGTLREALTFAAANGNSTPDFIYFNLPNQSETGRTITLLSQLPGVTSNLTIDASTQPGAVFGISTAKVQLITDFEMQNTFFGLELIGIQDVAIFGLYIRNLRPYPPDEDTNFWQGIAIRSCKNITIGAAGKGNVVSGFNYDLGINVSLNGGQIQYYSEDITLKNNFVGIEADGTTFSSLIATETAVTFAYGQIIIGGDPNEGNLFPKGLAVYQANSLNSTLPKDNVYSLPATVKIRNNKIGTNLAGNQKFTGTTGLNVASISPGGKNAVDIEDNIIASDGDGIHITNIGYQVNIKRNFIGTDRSLTKKLPLGTGIFVYWTDNVLIGGSTADANYIANCKPIHIYPFAKAVISKNSFFCTVDAYPMIFDTYGTRTSPLIRILNATTTSVVGTATPNSVIELFYSDLCGTCSPETYFASTTADALGNWQYNGPIIRTVIASATLDNFTSEFTRVLIDVTAVKLISTCTNTGAIKGAVPIRATDVKWFDEQGNLVGTEPDLLNVPPGKYKMKAYGGECNAETVFFEVQKSFTLNTANASKTNPSCNNTTGSIKGITANNSSPIPLTYSWKDAGNKEISKSIELLNVRAGIYTLTVSNGDGLCTQTYGPLKLENAIGPNVDETLLLVSASSCTTGTGAIKGITASGWGALTYKWKNEQGIQVGNTLDLINQPGGAYTLEVSDGSACGPVSTSAITITEINGVAINDPGVVKSANCGNSNGSITGMVVTGATTFEWYNSQNKLISTASTANLNNVPAGDYYLLAYNNSCSKKTKIYTIADLQNTTDYGQPQSEIINPNCMLPAGSIKITFSGTLPIAYRWVNKNAGQTVGTNSATLTDMPEGTYQLYAADDNNCERLIGTYQIVKEPVLVIVDATINITPDQCGLNRGEITGIKVTGKMPFSYEWINSEGIVVGTDLTISGLAQGQYQLVVTDGVNCSKMASYMVPNQDQMIMVPEIKDVQICGPGNATLLVNSVDTSYGYRFYDTKTSLNPLADKKLGQFTVSVNADRSYYVSQYSGTCESSRKEVKVRVGFSAVKIPNAFSPNGDGVNDCWVLKGTAIYPRMHVILFNRNGAKVYEATDYKNDFNGVANGNRLVVGTYYYLAFIDNACSPISGSLTILM